MTNWGRLVITNWDTVYYKLGQVLQIREMFIANWGRYNKLWRDLLQIGADITHWRN